MFNREGDLLDQITMQHGPRKLLARFFLIAEQEARDKGIKLRLSSDFHRMCATRRRFAETPMLPVPHFDPEQSDLRAETSFWIEGVDCDGETALIHAVRLFDWPHTTLKEELEALRVHYRDPAPHLAAGEYIRIAAPTAHCITGRNLFAGAMWVRRDHRGLGLTRIVPRISRALAYTHWRMPIVWGLVDPKLDAGGVSRAYGRYTVEPGVLTRLPWWGPPDAVLLWMRQETLLDEIQEIVAQSTTDLSRKMERPMIIASVPRRHGSRTRL